MLLLSKKNNGFILLSTVIILSTILLLLLDFLKFLNLNIKLYNNIYINYQEFYLLENSAKNISINIDKFALPKCVISNKINYYMQKEDLLKIGCQYKYKNKDFAYLINDLGSFPCLKIKNKNVETGSYHWLVNIMINNRILTLRVAYPIKTPECTTLNSMIINSGILSRWEY
ncbi:MAG: hypothetical protein A3E88_00805 [Legionellales bacterium RIFCSPHIGHO2_12_FULL_35_11]|nr:MAG: hypothetical protein A3E88_00805 [Legionellales bacterium RIFCSPHIGHO2_12_FULL_35_11]